MPPCSHFSTPHGSRSVFRCLHIPDLRCFHQGGSGATNGHGKPRNHEWTRMDTKKNSGTTNGHEWTRMAMGRGGEGRTTKHTKYTKKLRNHEWTRMDTNGYGQGRGGTTNGHGKPRNHEWTRMDTNDKDRRNHETHETHEKNSGTTNGHEWIPRRRQGRYRKTPRLLCPGPKSFGDISESAKSGGAGRRSCQEVSQDNDDIRHAHPGDEGGDVSAICEGSVCLRCLR